MKRLPPNLLVVSYFAPPDAVGVRRLASWMRWLPESGWRPIVLACGPSRPSGLDPSPLEDPTVATTLVRRTGSWDPYYRLQRGRPAPPSRHDSAASPSARSRALMQALRRHALVPDDRCGWIPFAVQGGLALCREHPIRAILSTSYPNSAHSAARRIAARARLPWVADFRDGWTQNPAFFDPGNPLARWLIERGERLCARAARRIVTVSPPITDHLNRLRPAGRSPAETIYNGFEPELLAPDGASREPLEPGRFTLLYTGTFFGRRTPVPFLRALATVLAARPEWRDRVRVRLRCALSADHRDALAGLKLGDVAQILPTLPFSQIVQEQRRADACLLVLEHGPGAEIMVSQKVFEYLAARRPILALVPGGAARDVLARSGGATVCTSPLAATITPVVQQFLARGLAGKLRGASPGDLAPFNRRDQARRLGALLDEAAS